MRARRCRALAAALLLAAPLGAVAGARAAPDEVTVGMTVLGFSPSRVEVRTGTVVIWHNQNLFDYPVVSGIHELAAEDGSFASPPINPGARWQLRFLRPGSFPYRDRRHPNLTGQVVVTGPPVAEVPRERDAEIVEPNPTDPNSWGYRPADLVVEAGTTVTWRNNGSQTHTVTAEDGSFDSGDLPPGATFRRTFEAPGVFRYHCTPHPWMQGVVRVAAPGATPPPPPAPTPAPQRRAAPPSRRAARGPGPERVEARIVEPDPAAPSSWGFEPQRVEARVGDTVVWRNTGAVPHTVTADDGSFDSGTLRPGAVFERRFEAPGVFRYHCTPHPWMRGVVAVAAAGATPPPAELAPAALPPPAAGQAEGGVGAESVGGGSRAPAGGRDPYPLQGVLAVAAGGLVLAAAFMLATGWTPAWGVARPPRSRTSLRWGSPPASRRGSRPRPRTSWGRSRGPGSRPRGRSG